MIQYQKSIIFYSSFLHLHLGYYSEKTMLYITANKLKFFA